MRFWEEALVCGPDRVQRRLNAVKRIRNLPGREDDFDLIFVERYLVFLYYSKLAQENPEHWWNKGTSINLAVEITKSYKLSCV